MLQRLLVCIFKWTQHVLIKNETRRRKLLDKCSRRNVGRLRNKLKARNARRRHKPGMVFALLLISMYTNHQTSAADEKLKLILHFIYHVMKTREAAKLTLRPLCLRVQRARNRVVSRLQLLSARQRKKSKPAEYRTQAAQPVHGYCID